MATSDAAHNELTDPRQVELVRRLDTQLESIFVKIQRDIQKNFDREAVKRIIFFCFAIGAEDYDRAKEAKVFRQSSAKLEKKINQILSTFGSLLKIQMPPFYKQALQDAQSETFGRLATVLNVLRDRRKTADQGWKLTKETLSRKNCLAAKDAVTMLVDYFWPARTDYQQATLYRLVGETISKVSSPACVVCKKRHGFRDYRNVRSIDQHKGPWNERENRVTKLRVERHHAWLKLLEASDFAPEVIKAQDKSLNTLRHREIFRRKDLDLLPEHIWLRMENARRLAAKLPSQ